MEDLGKTLRACDCMPHSKYIVGKKLENLRARIGKEEKSLNSRLENEKDILGQTMMRARLALLPMMAGRDGFMVANSYYCAGWIEKSDMKKGIEYFLRINIPELKKEMTDKNGHLYQSQILLHKYIEMQNVYESLSKRQTVRYNGLTFNL